MKPFGFAFIGLDHWYNGFPMLAAIEKSPHARLLWVTDENLGRARTLAEKHGAAKTGSDYEQALADPEVDVIATYSSSDKNAAICIAAAEAGKHIICIKPMAMNLEEADRVVAAVNTAGVRFFPVAASHLFYNTYRTFKGWIGEGRIGDLLTTNSFFYASLPRDWPDSTTPGWFADPKRVPGGAWIDHAIYYIQVFRDAFGAEVVRVQGTAKNLKYPELALEDYGKAILTFEGGQTAAISANWLGVPRANRFGMEFFGSEGTLVWDTLLEKIAITGNFDPELKGWLHLDPPEQDQTRDEKIIAHLADCIREDAPTLVTVEDARINLAVALAFYEAARTHRAVEMDDLI